MPFIHTIRHTPELAYAVRLLERSQGIENIVNKPVPKGKHDALQHKIFHHYFKARGQNQNYSAATNHELVIG